MIETENLEMEILVKGSLDQLCELEDHLKFVFDDLDFKMFLRVCDDL